jgi:hypothetical protein
MKKKLAGQAGEEAGVGSAGVGSAGVGSGGKDSEQLNLRKHMPEVQPVLQSLPRLTYPFQQYFQQYFFRQSPFR